MPEFTMEGIPYNSVINWNKLVHLLSRLNEPVKVEVTDAESDVVDASEGDELMVGQVNMDRYAVSTVSDDDHKDWTGGALPNETIRSAKIPTHFRLFPRHDKDHCFRSVKEIIETLPAVCKFIFTINGFDYTGMYVKPRERLEIFDLVRDSATGSRLLFVKSVKTGLKITLKENMEAPFFQLPSDCYKCGEHGISASDLLACWIPGQAPFIVKYLSPSKEVRQADLEKKFITLKPDKKNKRVKPSKSIDVCQSTPHVRDGFPQHLRDQQLFFRPYYAATVQNITRNQEDIILSENSELTVRILPPSKISRSAESSVNSGRSLSSPRASYDQQLQDIVSKVNWRTTTFLITGGEIATTLRELDAIRKGHRIAVLKLISSTKAVLISQRNEMFLVGTAYGGKFICERECHKEVSAEEICTKLPPFDVEVIAKDKDIGHDQLHIRKCFQVNEILTEWTAYVEVFGSNGRRLSHQPFEIPLCRNPLHARADEPISIFQTISLSKAKYVAKLPVVEMVTKDDVDAIRIRWRPDVMMRNHQRNEFQTAQGAADARQSYPRPANKIRASWGPDSDLGLLHSYQRQDDGIWNYYGRDDAMQDYPRLDDVTHCPQMRGDEIRKYHDGLDDTLRSYLRKDGVQSVFNFDDQRSSILEVESDEEIFLPDNLSLHSMNSPPSNSDVPPPRPPKSPALRQMEYERMQGVDLGDEILRLDITDYPVSPQRPPKPDRFKSPQHGLNFNHNSNIQRNITRCDDTAVIAIGASFDSKREVPSYTPLTECHYVQDDLKLRTIQVASAPDSGAHPKGKDAPRKSSFDILHESYSPWNFTKEDKSNSINSSYELLSNSNSMNLPTAEYAMYVDPRLLHKKHLKTMPAQTIPNPNYEDSIRATMFSHQRDSEEHSSVTASSDANSHCQRHNAFKNRKLKDYSFADDPKAHPGATEVTLIDDNLDYETIPPILVTKYPDEESAKEEEEDYEFAVYEKLSP